MKKTYTVNDILFNEVSHSSFQTKGTLEYFLVDEFGDSRKVITMATVGYGKKIKTVRALYKREEPLVEALKNADIGQEVTIDFASFNQNQQRSRLVSIRKNPDGRTIIRNPSCLNQPGSIIPDFTRIPILMAWVALGTTIVFLLGIF